MPNDRTLNGILPVWKPVGCTSHDVVAKIRRLAHQKRAGHTGTLDPQVEGVLPLCLGKATRVAEYVQDLPKTYEGTLTLGIATDTEDQQGTIVEKVVVGHISEVEIVGTFARFVGEIEQTPPMFSAVKVNGRRLYQIAREGRQIERKSRKVNIYRLEFVGFHQSDYPQIDFSVQCSKGTYIRTLCVDIGRALGYPAHMSHLVRVKSGPFSRDDCVTLAQLEQTPREVWIRKWLRPLDSGLRQFPAYTVSEQDRFRIVSGQSLSLADVSIAPNTLLRVYASTECLALYRVDETGEHAKPVKVFAEKR